jgi:hypothetical protein
VDQRGYSRDWRIGHAGDLSGDRDYDVLLVHSLNNMQQKVSYLDWFLDGTTQDLTTHMVTVVVPLGRRR